jgi:hypothetical protein
MFQMNLPVLVDWVRLQLHRQPVTQQDVCFGMTVSALWQPAEAWLQPTLPNRQDGLQYRHCAYLVVCSCGMNALLILLPPPLLLLLLLVVQVGVGEVIRGWDAGILGTEVRRGSSVRCDAAGSRWTAHKRLLRGSCRFGHTPHCS